jgi:hypothetical protein
MDTNKVLWLLRGEIELGISMLGFHLYDVLVTELRKSRTYIHWNVFYYQPLRMTWLSHKFMLLSTTKLFIGTDAKRLLRI